MAKSSFPRGDNEFANAIDLFYEFINTNKAKYPNFDAARLSSLDAMRGTFRTSLEDKIQKDADAQAATAKKNLEREQAEDAYNKAAAEFKLDATAEDLAAAGFEERDETPTATTAPTTRPIGTVDTSQRFEHKIGYVDETSPATGRRAKPDGVRSCQIWKKVGGAPPVDISECDFLVEDTATPYIAKYTGADAGKTAYYILLWVSTRGELGPPSETVAATITG